MLPLIPGDLDRASQSTSITFRMLPFITKTDSLSIATSKVPKQVQPRNKWGLHLLRIRN